MEDALVWLNAWETDTFKNKIIAQEEFLTRETAHGLRVTLRSTLDLCKYLIDKYNFKYLLTGKVNQDNLEVIHICPYMLSYRLYKNVLTGHVIV